MLKKFFSAVFFSILLVFNAFGQEKKTVDSASGVKEIPVSYGVVVDNSGSYRTILDKVIKLVHNVVEENKPDDKTFLVRFVDSAKIRIVQDFTSDKDEIRAASDEMFIEGGLTAILDAVIFSAKHLAENANKDSSRRALILISDGEDRQSRARIEDVLKFLKDEKIQVFTIGLADGKIFPKNLNRLSKETGGKSFAPKSQAEISIVVKELAAAMRAR